MKIFLGQLPEQLAQTVEQPPQVEEPSQQSGKIHRYGGMYYKDNKWGICRYWRGNKGMNRRQLYAFTQRVI